MVLTCLGYVNLLVINILEHIKLEMDTSSCKKLPFDSEYLHTDLYYRQSSTTVGNNAVGVLIK